MLKWLKITTTLIFILILISQQLLGEKMGKVTVEGFLTDKEVEEINKNRGGYRIITGFNLNPEYVKHLRKINNNGSKKKKK